MVSSPMKLRKPAFVLSIVFWLSPSSPLAAQQPEMGEGHSSDFSFLVVDAPSTSSGGDESVMTADSIVRYGSDEFKSVFFNHEHDLHGLGDIACSCKGPMHVVAGYSDSHGVSELLDFNESGKIVHRFRLPGDTGGIVAVTFDHEGNLYAAQNSNLYKNGVLLTNKLSNLGWEVGKLAADRKGNLFLTMPLTSQLLRIDPKGKVTVFADAAEGLSGPFGLAVGPHDEIFVANNPPNLPGEILKFESSGAHSTFASDIYFQPDIRGMVLDAERDDRHGDHRDHHREFHLYAAPEYGPILKFDSDGSFNFVPNGSYNLVVPVALAHCPVHHSGGKDERGDED